MKVRKEASRNRINVKLKHRVKSSNLIHNWLMAAACGRTSRQRSASTGCQTSCNLPSSHLVVSMIIRFYHQLSGHSGSEHVFFMIRERFWIVKGRSAVRKNLNGCFQCKKRQAPVGEQKMANLPRDRTTPDKPPFTFVGVDCFGPFLVRRRRTTAKRYGVLFTCMAILEIHIEVVHSLDTDSFLNIMRRFIARRAFHKKSGPITAEISCAARGSCEVPSINGTKRQLPSFSFSEAYSGRSTPLQVLTMVVCGNVASALFER